MVRITGNLEVDYVLTVITQLMITTINYIAVFAKYVLVKYPQLAGIVLVLVGAYIAYYLIKNAVKIIVSLVKTIIKIIVILTLFVTFTWIYVRGVDRFQQDFHFFINYIQNFDSNLDNLKDYFTHVKKSTNMITAIVKEMLE